MEILQNEKFDLNNKIINQEGDILQFNMKEEMAIKKINELQEELDNIVVDKKDLEIEFIALKKNYNRIDSEWEELKRKHENLGMELIN